MTNSDLKIIRQRLGWSTAEMARRIGDPCATIRAWEAGEAEPGREALNQYHFLQNGLEEAASQLANAPLAESKLEADGLAQVRQRELLNDL